MPLVTITKVVSSTVHNPYYSLTRFELPFRLSIESSREYITYNATPSRFDVIPLDLHHPQAGPSSGTELLDFHIKTYETSIGSLESQEATILISGSQMS